MTGRQTSVVVALVAFLNGVGVAVIGNYYFEFTPLYGEFLAWHTRRGEPEHVQFTGLERETHELKQTTCSDLYFRLVQVPWACAPRH